MESAAKTRMNSNPEWIAEKGIAELAGMARVSGYEVVRFTPSIKMGRRYLGLKDPVSGKQFLLTLEVEEGS